MFVGRRRELGALIEGQASGKPQFVRVLGRRRVGKTEMLHQLLSREEGVYLHVPAADLPTVLETLDDQLATQMSGTRGRSTNFREFLDHLEARRPKIVVFDEFQHLMELGRGAESEIQRRWDLSWQRAGPSVVLCGSSIGMMQRLVSGRAPLYGRATLHVHLRPLPYAEAREFHPHLPEEERIRRYAVFGGTPYYQGLAVGGSLPEAIRRTLLVPEGPLLNEPEWVLSSQYREPRRYQSILELLAHGPQTQHALESKLGVSTGGLSWYLRSLQEDMDLIRHVGPVLGKARLGRFELADPFFRFYYRHILPRLNLVEMGRGDDALAAIGGQLETFVGPVFEEVVHEVLWRAKALGGTPHHPVAVGRWWNRIGEELDAVCVTDREVWVGEVKWGDRRIDVETVEKLLATSARIEHLEGKTLRPFVATRGDLHVAARQLLTERGGAVLGLPEIQAALTAR